jgi:DNA-binding CsgD family transcriptional regulator
VRMPEDLEKWVKQNRAALASTDELFPPPMPYTRRREGRQLVVRLVRGRAQDLLHLEERATALHPESLRHLSLTRREAEVLVLVTQGKTNAGIGDALGTSPETVAKHLGHIYEKLGVGTRAAAAARALESTVRTPFYQHPQRGR